MTALRIVIVVVSIFAAICVVGVYCALKMVKDRYF